MRVLSFYSIFFVCLFLSSFLVAQEKEERKFNFPGYTIEKCLKDYEIAKKPKRRVAKLPSQKAQRFLKRLFPALEEDDLLLALEILDEMKISEGLTNVDKAQMWYYYAYAVSYTHLTLPTIYSV